ncbi:TIGR03862 family flavoprotein [Marivita sp. S6314]|uniref:TIGR03862 family flavoprotein n=1 Tax=Marivita sp. S6314 TaxID=2926406 RepID=UPI001FF6DC47|nr:TIGR03862 family flavoprotein [Marivita sp. S6314]MCK0151790.1 TIGR03862 family flavoprotein [Marivita sp. S6314]
MTDALVIGGGPAGLMAADALLSAGRAVTLVEAKPSIGRKFLMAGKSGLNLTKMQPFGPFLSAYGGGLGQKPGLRNALHAFDPEAVRDWAEDLGQATFTGSTGRLFPKVMKASPLLRAWLERLDGMGLTRHTRWRWTGWDANACLFDTPDGQRVLTPRVTVFALGGSSWARLGSDGAWAEQFAANGIGLAPFQPSNAGLLVDWSDHMDRHFGAPLKNIALTAGGQISRGEVVISKRGLEGGGIYTLTPQLREGHTLHLDLVPDLPLDTVTARLAKPRGKQSLSSFLRKTLKLSSAAQAMLREFVSPLPDTQAALAQAIKAIPVRHAGLRPMDEAISTAGGVSFDALDDALMLRDRPGTFCAGEMLDWDAPTGGYLLTACFATGRWAGRHAAEFNRP